VAFNRNPGFMQDDAGQFGIINEPKGGPFRLASSRLPAGSSIRKGLEMDTKTYGVVADRALRLIKELARHIAEARADQPTAQVKFYADALYGDSDEWTLGEEIEAIADCIED
jgi:hypothetical protein